MSENTKQIKHSRQQRIDNESNFDFEQWRERFFDDLADEDLQLKKLIGKAKLKSRLKRDQKRLHFTIKKLKKKIVKTSLKS